MMEEGIEGGGMFLCRLLVVTEEEEEEMGAAGASSSIATGASFSFGSPATNASYKRRARLIRCVRIAEGGEE